MLTFKALPPCEYLGPGKSALPSEDPFYCFQLYLTIIIISIFFAIKVTLYAPIVSVAFYHYSQENPILLCYSLRFKLFVVLCIFLVTLYLHSVTKQENISVVIL